MRYQPWMNEDERSPEQIRKDKLLSLRHEETELIKRLDAIRYEIAQLSGQ